MIMCLQNNWVGLEQILNNWSLLHFGSFDKYVKYSMRKGKYLLSLLIFVKPSNPLIETSFRLNWNTKFGQKITDVIMSQSAQILGRFILMQHLTHNILSLNGVKQSYMVALLLFSLFINVTASALSG